jgi:ADP-heptose:LPS heptosyltransferase
MNVDFMRRIDRSVGVPLCFLLSLVYGFRKRISKPKLIKDPKKILFIEMSEMGSIVLAYSLFKKTKELWPEAELYFLTFEETRHAIDILDVLPKENVITINSCHFFAFLYSAISALWRLRRAGIKLAVDMELFARFTSILSYLSGAKNRVGYFKFHNEGLYRGNFLTHKVAFNPHIHIAHNLLDLIFAVASTEQDVPFTKKKIEEKDIVLPRLKISEEAKRKIQAKLAKENKEIADAREIILLNPNTSDIIPVRRWPLEGYVGLSKRLLNHSGVYIVITGTEAEKSEADKIRDAVNSERCINFSGKTTFSELMALYSISDILITNDSGPAHFSVLTGIKTFVFFGPETPRLYGPLSENSHVFYSDYACSPCVSAFNHRKSACIDNKCLKSISVEEVYSEVKRVFEKKE